MLRTVEEAAQTLHVTVEPAPVNDAASIAALASRKDGGFLILPDFFTMANRTQLLAAIGEARVPAVFWSRTFVEEGGLMSYSTDSAEQLRRAASYIDRILRARRRPICRSRIPPRSSSTINLKTAKALGVSHSRGPARTRGRRHRMSVAHAGGMADMLTFAARFAPARFQEPSANTYRGHSLSDASCAESRRYRRYLRPLNR